MFNLLILFGNPAYVFPSLASTSPAMPLEVEDASDLSELLVDYEAFDWEEANLDVACSYLRVSKRVKVPREFKNLIPK